MTGGPLVLIFMGVAGSGKSTIGKRAAEALGAEFFEGDDYHPAGNVEKMRRGLPLTEADRAPWFTALRRVIEEVLAGNRLAVMTCSALKADYREKLRQGDARVRFVYLKVSEAVLRARLQARQGHFLAPSLLAEQLRIFEPPSDALVLDAEKPPEEMVARLKEAIGPG